MVDKTFSSPRDWFLPRIRISFYSSFCCCGMSAELGCGGLGRRNADQLVFLAEM